MRKSRFTENEMVRAVKQFESGVSADTISRELGISRMTLFPFRGEVALPDTLRPQALTQQAETFGHLMQRK